MLRIYKDRNYSSLQRFRKTINTYKFQTLTAFIDKHLYYIKKFDAVDLWRKGAGNCKKKRIKFIKNVKWNETKKAAIISLKLQELHEEWNYKEFHRIFALLNNLWQILKLICS